ncbi:hypothetical protein [Mycolicibacterium pyrenivorans]|uniref:hypothetical protein n=1 Tax=Mycolicibacterium pyrenivorans TaxID=187102 RepID=UPI0021F38772|nr:hypothetical protein [Mycolicibacterium pyrenivorans]MCV7154726.1 hypothetical protein [Mycolicibacterium pyrenivorans]
MTARTFEADDLALVGRKGPGVRASDEQLLGYDVTVIAADVGGVVAAAGGWLCDRVRAGWQVTVLVPRGCDTRALTILGVRSGVWESGADTLRLISTAALAIDARVLHHDDAPRRELLRKVDGGGIEITVWGESGLFAADRRFGRVRHRLSAAARAYKQQALSCCGAACEQVVEEFVSSALWYPPDGTDLAPIPARQ